MRGYKSQKVQPELTQKNRKAQHFNVKQVFCIVCNNYALNLEVGSADMYYRVKNFQTLSVKTENEYHEPFQGIVILRSGNCIFIHYCTVL